MRRGVLGLKITVLRHLFVSGLVLLIGLSMGPAGAFAQSGNAQDQSAKPATANAPAADPTKENQRKTDEFVEAAQAINGPAGNPECVWLGRRVVRLMWAGDPASKSSPLAVTARFCCSG